MIGAASLALWMDVIDGRLLHEAGMFIGTIIPILTLGATLSAYGALVIAPSIWFVKQRSFFQFMAASVAGIFFLCIFAALIIVFAELI